MRHNVDMPSADVPGERSGAGDPDRTLALLWRDRTDGPRRGPRPGLTVDTVVDAATRLADVAGLGAVTMRRLAEDLGVAPMTLYTYVPGKDELLDLMLDAAYLAMPRPDRSALGWRDRVRGVAEDNRALFAAHPWAATVGTGRPPLGPGQIAKYEHELRAFDGTAVGDVDRDAALALVLGFVGWHAAREADVAAARRATAMDDERWWAANAPLLARVLDESAYPTASRVGSAAGAAHGGTWGAAHAWEFGLGVLVAGLGPLVEPDAA